MSEMIHLIKSSEHTVVFTGAGMSTESGLPDFRSAKDGLWEKFNPNELANVQALKYNRDAFIDFYRYRLQELKKYQPHDGHYILADWEKQGLIQGIITQNVDGFHYDAGNKNVMELHGTFRSFHCHACGEKYDANIFFDGKNHCNRCNGTIRPSIVLFGEPLPKKTFSKAEFETIKADLFIVLGSSLTVSPANMFPMLAKDNGAKLIIVNHDQTTLDSFADFIIQDKSIKQVLIDWNDEVIP